MRFMRTGLLLMALVATSGCSPDPTSSQEYQALEADLQAARQERDALADQVQELGGFAVSPATATVEGLAATSEVVEFLDAYHDAFARRDVAAVLAMYHPDGQWISDTPPGRDVYIAEDGEFSPMAFTNPIGGFVRWLETVDFAFDSRGDPQMIANSQGDIYVSFSSSWYFTYQSRDYHITAFTVMWLVNTPDGLLIKRHWNLTPQTVMSP